jgi:hypothetical protein
VRRRSPNVSGDQPTEYVLRLRLPDGREKAGGSFTTRRRRDAGDFVNLPTGPDNRSHPGSGYVWRVVGVEDEGRTLILEFDRPHAEMRSDSARGD